MATRNWPMVAERLRGEKLLTLSQAAKLLPVDNPHGHVSIAAMVRWIVHGKRNCFLDAVKAGRGWLTSEAAVLRFAAAIGSVEAGR